jgi:Protein of unknown function (DUF2752)
MAPAVSFLRAHARARRRAVGEVLLALMLASPMLARGGVVLCPFRRVTGRYCPFCGLTRSFSQLMRGRIRESVAEHPLGPAAAVACVACLASTPLKST